VCPARLEGLKIHGYLEGYLDVKKSQRANRIIRTIQKNLFPFI